MTKRILSNVVIEYLIREITFKKLFVLFDFVYNCIEGEMASWNAQNVFVPYEISEVIQHLHFWTDQYSISVRNASLTQISWNLVCP